MMNYRLEMGGKAAVSALFASLAIHQYWLLAIVACAISFGAGFLLAPLLQKAFGKAIGEV